MSPVDGLCKGPEAAHSWHILFLFFFSELALSLEYSKENTGMKSPLLGL